MIPLAAILSIGEKVLDKVLPDPEAKAKAQASLMEMAQRGELAQLEAQVKEMQSARDREVGKEKVNLTQNFTLSEMTKSETALRYGMANDPTETEIENMRLLCEKVLQPVRTDTRWLTPRSVGLPCPITARALPQTSRFLVLPTLIWPSG
jgi:hypothetical protein